MPIASTLADRTKDAMPATSNPTTSRSYDKNASIVLIGIRGTGTSTLAVMASSALGFRLVDADQHFYQATGFSRAAHKSAHGVAQYRQEELRVMRSMLSENQTHAVIACGPGVVEGTAQTWFLEYMESHPIIYILRDEQGIQKHLRIWDAETISRLIRLSCPTYRALSNFEFYNLSDYPSTHSGDESPKSLSLKHMEHDFLQLIYAITRRGPRTEYETCNSLPSPSPESRPYTYALSLPLSTFASTSSKLRGVDIVADALELLISFSDVCENDKGFDNSAANRLSRHFYRARRSIHLPIIFHVRLPDEPGHAAETPSTENAYFDMLHHGLRLAPEYLCVDLSCNPERIENLVAAKGSTKIIAHYFDRDPGINGWDSPERLVKLRLAEQLGCDLVQLCQEATSMADNFSVQHFMNTVKQSGHCSIPLIAYNTGRLGRMSRFFNPTFTPVTLPLIRSLAPECGSTSHLTVPEAQSAIYASFLMDRMTFGIYGGNVSRNLAPSMHNAALRFCGMPHEYKTLQDSTFESLLQDENFGGASITAPFKTQVIHVVDQMSREARAIGAVNTVLPLRSLKADSLLEKNRAGKIVALYGENTDWIGICRFVRLNLSPINAVKRRTTGLIIGAGGMARAATYALIRLGIQTIFIHNRTLRKAEELASQFREQSFASSSSCDSGSSLGPFNIGAANHHLMTSNPKIRILPSKADPWPADVDLPTIVVSCVAVENINGKPSVDTSLPAHWLESPNGGVAFELCLAAGETSLLKQVRNLSDSGWIAIDGLQVFPEQGIRQFELFTGRKAPRELMRTELFRAYKERINHQRLPMEAPSDTGQHV
ncbi:type I 3-dehydroquinase-domain-containing protein [Ilyonectria destructans]|nr:type I 3-dehydroquinase-domain-containing protein [Ilyonectria destructans]